MGGHWEVAAPQTTLIKEGLVRLSCLLSFDIITLDLWTQIAPHWMVTIGGYLKKILSIDMRLFSVHHYPKENLQELSSIFCKIFDPDMSPLAFELEDMYKYGQQPQWLQCLEILTPTLLHLDSSLCGWSVPLPSSSARWRSGSRLSATSGSSFRWRCSVLLSPA